MSGVVVRVPAGIANTAIGLLQRDKKTSVFAEWSVFARASTPDVASFRAIVKRATRCAARSRSKAQKFFRLIENTDNIRVSATTEFFSIATNSANARGARDHKNRRDEALSMPNSLWEKFWVKRLAKVSRTVESSTNRANRLQVIR